mgnify:CR=1 FL=1
MPTKNPGKLRFIDGIVTYWHYLCHSSETHYVSLMSFLGVSIYMNISSWLRVQLGALSTWGNRNFNSIFTGAIVAILMMVIMVIQDMRYTSREIANLRDQSELIRISEELMEDLTAVEEFADFQSDIAHKQREEIERRDLYIMQANEAIRQLSARLSYAQQMLDTLKEYLKKLGEWPPKVAPPQPQQPVDPDSLAGRSEA